MAKISASVSDSTGLLFQLLASLGSFLMGAKGVETTATGVVGMKLDLAAVEATAGGKEGTVIWARRAEGREARTNCSGAAGAATAATVSATGATEVVGVATFLTVIDFTSGTGVAFLEDATDATLALAAGVDLMGVTTAFWGAGAAVLVLTGLAFGAGTTFFGFLRVFAADGAALFFSGVGTTLAGVLVLLNALTGGADFTGTTFLAGTVLADTAFLAGAALAGTAFLAGAALAGTAFLAGAALAGTTFLGGAALAEVFFTGAATFFFGVVTSCLLAV